MKLIIIFFLLFKSLNLYLISYSESYLLIKLKKYNLDLVSFQSGFYSESTKNEISVKNNYFYYITFDDIYWKDILIKNKNTFFTFYLDSIETFNRYYSEIIEEKKVKILIIGVGKNFDKKEIKIDETNKYIFINKDNDKIKKYFLNFSKRNICSTFITIYYIGDIIFDNLIPIFGIFIIIFTIIFGILYYKSKKENTNYIFTYDFILTILIIYLFHTLFLYILSLRGKYKYFDEQKFSGVLYIIFNIFLFFTKLFPNLFCSFQTNFLEVREFTRINMHSKVIQLLGCSIFFLINFQRDNTELSEFLNCMFYLINLICIFCLFLSYKKCLDDKYAQWMQNHPDNIPTLIIKKKLLYRHFISCVLFILFHIFFYIIMRNYLIEYRTTKFMLIFIYYSDLILVIIITFVHFPRKLPDNFVEEESESLNETIIQNIEEDDSFRYIYNYSSNEKNEEEYFSNYNKKECADLVIIENPFNESQLDEYNTNVNLKEEKDSKDNIEEKQILIDKNYNDDKINVINDMNDMNDINSNDKDILDLTHTKLGFIDLSF